MNDGILIIDKPVDWTSHDVVGRTRRILQTKRVGHTGTLDPFATGVLVILVGKATRLAQFLDKNAKEYEAVVRFGYETTTGDLTGEAKESRITNHELQIDEIENALQDFRGQIEQIPPMYSAKKIDGVKLYELARKGIEVERKPVSVNIYELELLESMENGKWKMENEERQKSEPEIRTFDFRLRVVCSAGTYIRTLAEDIGRKLGGGAHLAALRRTRAGKFNIENAFTLEELENLAAADKLENVLISTNEAVSHLAEVKLSADEIVKIKNGMKFRKNLPLPKNEDFLRLTEGEKLLAIGAYDESESIVQPKIVLT